MSNASGRTSASRTHPLVFWLLAGAFFALPLNALRFGPSISLGDVMLLLAIAGMIAAIIARPDDVPYLPAWFFVGAAVLLASILVTELLGPPASLQNTVILTEFRSYEGLDSSNLSSGIRLIAVVVVLPVLTIFCATSRARVRTLSTFWIAGITVGCLLVVIDYLSGSDLRNLVIGLFWHAETPDFGGRAAGLTVHPTTLSLTAAMVAPLALFRIKDPQTAFIYGSVLAVLLVAMGLSGSRGGLVALIGALLIGSIWFSRIQVVTLLLVLASLGALLAVPSQDSIQIIERTSPGNPYTSLSNEARLGRFDDSIELIVESPVVGYGFDSVRASHNIPAQLLLAGGVLALTGYSLIVIGFLVEGLRQRRKAQGLFKGELSALCVSILVYVIAGMFYAQIFDRYLLMPAALIGAVAFARRDALAARMCGLPAPRASGARSLTTGPRP